MNFQVMKRLEMEQVLVTIRLNEKHAVEVFDDEVCDDVVVVTEVNCESNVKNDETKDGEQTAGGTTAASDAGEEMANLMMKGMNVLYHLHLK